MKKFDGVWPSPISILSGILGAIVAAGMACAEGRGTASVATCYSLETEFEDGTRSEVEYRAHLIRVEDFGGQMGENRTDLFVLGPTVSGASGGIFYKTAPIIFSSKPTRKSILAAAAKRELMYGWIANDVAQVPARPGRMIYYVRPATEVKRGHSGLGITEFECSQVLF